MVRADSSSCDKLDRRSLKEFRVTVCARPDYQSVSIYNIIVTNFVSGNVNHIRIWLHHSLQKRNGAVSHDFNFVFHLSINVLRGPFPSFDENSGSESTSLFIASIIASLLKNSWLRTTEEEIPQ